MAKTTEKIVPISDLQAKAGEIVDQVQDTEEAVVITRRGRASAVLIDYATYEGLLATREELSYPDWHARLARAEADSRAGKGTSLSDYKRSRKK